MKHVKTQQAVGSTNPSHQAAGSKRVEPRKSDGELDDDDGDALIAEGGRSDRDGLNKAGTQQTGGAKKKKSGGFQSMGMQKRHSSRICVSLSMLALSLQGC